MSADVVVTNPTFTSTDDVSYTWSMDETAVITEVSPSRGGTGGGTTVTITGTKLELIIVYVKKKNF